MVKVMSQKKTSIEFYNLVKQFQRQFDLSGIDLSCVENQGMRDFKHKPVRQPRLHRKKAHRRRSRSHTRKVKVSRVSQQASERRRSNSQPPGVITATGSLAMTIFGARQGRDPGLDPNITRRRIPKRLHEIKSDVNTRDTKSSRNQ